MKHMAVALALVAPLAMAQPAPIVAHAKSGQFDAVKEDLVLAIQGQGLVIDHTSHIGAMLDRTGKDLGAKRRIYHQAEALLFCSASVSRRTMEADPLNIAYCPYVIAMYVRPEEPNTVRVVYRRTLPIVDELLERIVREALDLR
jgi:hypothetical protein